MIYWVESKIQHFKTKHTVAWNSLVNLLFVCKKNIEYCGIHLLKTTFMHNLEKHFNIFPNPFYILAYIKPVRKNDEEKCSKYFRNKFIQ